MLRTAFVSLAAASSLLAAPSFDDDVLPILEFYCIDCHADRKNPKGDLNLERFESEDLVMADRSVWASVYDQVEAGQMPPPKEKFTLTGEEREALLGYIRDLLARPDPVLAAQDPGKPVLRRLTRLEYNNSVRDLLGLETDVIMFPERLPFANKAYFKPASGKMGDQLFSSMREFGSGYPVLLPLSGLPGDSRAAHGYTNRGDVQGMSPLVFEKFVGLAQEIAAAPRLEHTDFFRTFLADPSQPLPPAPPLVEFRADDPHHRRTAKAILGNRNSSPLPNQPPLYQEIRNISEDVAAGTTGILDAEGAPLDLEPGAALVLAFGTPASPLQIELRPDLPLRSAPPADGLQAASGKAVFQLEAGTTRIDLRLLGTPGDRGIRRITVTALGLGGFPKDRVKFRLHPSRGERHTTSVRVPVPNGKRSTFIDLQHPEGGAIDALEIVTPQPLQLDDLTFTLGARAIPEAEMPPRRPLAAAELAAIARERLAALLPRAFRRPVTDEEIDLHLRPFRESLAARGFTDAMRDSLAAVLASPDFLYRSEPVVPGSGTVRPLDGFEIASRLSYFLWSTTPDAELLAAAADGQLATREGLDRQVARMLRDPKVRELSESFAYQWLRLDQMYTTKPDRDLFPGFYFGEKGTLHAPALTEALLLFETVLVEDRSVVDLIGADFTWVNPPLRKLYGLPRAEGEDAPGSRWDRVRLPDRSRGGVLTMSGPLTVTSLPFRTSPVKRGAWLLETILNRPPIEPKVAFALKDDTKEAAQATTVRQRFEQHRDDPNCFSCHVRLDPPGFALEAYDPIGRWRTEDGSSRVDASGEWDGAAFAGPAEFKELLVSAPHPFVRGFIEHLLSYALGRELDYFDRPVVDRIEKAAAREDHRFSVIIHELVASYPFLHIRNEPATTASR